MEVVATAVVRMIAAEAPTVLVAVALAAVVGCTVEFRLSSVAGGSTPVVKVGSPKLVSRCVIPAVEAEEEEKEEEEEDKAEEEKEEVVEEEAEELEEEIGKEEENDMLTRAEAVPEAVVPCFGLVCSEPGGGELASSSVADSLAAVAAVPELLSEMLGGSMEDVTTGSASLGEPLGLAVLVMPLDGSW